jgi:hypothetical protein
MELRLGESQSERCKCQYSDMNIGSFHIGGNALIGTLSLCQNALAVSLCECILIK